MTCKSQAARTPLVDFVDRAAVGASLLCLIHCAGLPILLALLPALSEILALPESLHLWLLAFAVPTSLIALGLGYREHGRAYPPAIALIGLTMMAAGAVPFGSTPMETPLTIIGSLALAGAHIGNWRHRHGRHRHG